jgi:hypothetical protein
VGVTLGGGSVGVTLGGGSVGVTLGGGGAMELLVVVGRRFLKKVSKVLMACCVGDPSVRKGAAGRGLHSSVTRFSNASVTRSAEDVVGMENLVGRNTTVSQTWMAGVVVMNTEYLR